MIQDYPLKNLTPDLADLSPENIKNYIRTESMGRKLICLETVDSTNNEGKRRSCAEREGTVIVSNRQTAGRGRLGREWTSPGGKGIWMSILLKPDLPTAKIPRLTMVAAAAICLALESVNSSLWGKVQIKWPNDILLRGKKAGGILTEMQVSGDRLQSVVLGIGLNVNLGEGDFPEELRTKATSLFLETGVPFNREVLIAEILNCFEPLYQDYLREGNLGESLEICRRQSAVIGKKVLLLEKGAGQEAEVLDLGPQGELLVKLANGHTASILSGEISLRL